MVTMAWAMAQSFSSSGTPMTKARSIFSVVIGNFLR
jgi:hypothetical protein